MTRRRPIYHVRTLFAWRAGWPGCVDASRPAGRFFRNRPWHGRGYLHVGPWVVGWVPAWERDV